MAFSGIGKLIKDLVTGTPADTDYFAFGNTDLKKVSFPNLKKALGIDALNSALENISLTNITSVNFGYDNANAFYIVFNLPNSNIAKLSIDNDRLRYLFYDGNNWNTIWIK